MEDELKWAIQNGDMQKVKDIIEVEGFDINIEINNGRAPIHHAADYGQTDIIEVLLAKGADVNAHDKHGITPLLAAIYEGHTEAVKLLLSKGADKNVKGTDGKSCVDSAEKAEIKALLA